MFRIRRSLEPDLKEIITENKILLYSILTAYPKAPKMDEIKEMIEHYFFYYKFSFPDSLAIYAISLLCLSSFIYDRPSSNPSASKNGYRSLYGT